MYFLKKISKLQSKNIYFGISFLKLYNLYLMVKFFFLRVKKIAFFNFIKKIKKSTFKKKLSFSYIFTNKFKKNKSIFKKKKKIKKKKFFFSNSNVLLLNKIKYHRYFNSVIKLESQTYKNNSNYFYDIRGKYSSHNSYIWCINFLTARYLLLIQTRNIFKKKGYFKYKKNILHILKKKVSVSNVISYDNSINWFQKWKILNFIMNSTLISSKNIYLFSNNTIFTIYLDKHTNITKKLKKELVSYNLNLNQIETPNRFFSNKKNTHSIWK